MQGDGLGTVIVDPLNIDFTKINNAKLADILRASKKLHGRLVAAGDMEGALALQRLVHSRIAANAENRRASREYRELHAAYSRIKEPETSNG
jgi:hypothetical protein